MEATVHAATKPKSVQVLGQSQRPQGLIFAITSFYLQINDAQVKCLLMETKEMMNCSKASGATC
eukprot:6480475-Amphidinium_carterae.1